MAPTDAGDNICDFIFSVSLPITLYYREAFGKAYGECYETVTWIAAWMLCWPMKLTFVCNLVQALGGRKICNPDGKIDVGIGEGYAILLGFIQFSFFFSAITLNSDGR